MAAPSNATLDLRPLRIVYAASDPAAEAAFVAKYFQGERLADPAEAAAANFGDVFQSCYQAEAVRWVSSTGYAYELWWVHSPQVPDGPEGLRLRDYEQYLIDLHGNISHGAYDSYMDNHVCIVMQSADPLVESLQADFTPYFIMGQFGTLADLFIEGPSGQVYEVLSHKETLVSDYPNWNLCQPEKLRTDVRHGISTMV